MVIQFTIASWIRVLCVYGDSVYLLVLESTSSSSSCLAFGEKNLKSCIQWRNVGL